MSSGSRIWVGDRQTPVQRAQRILEDHLHARPLRAPRGRSRCGHRLAIEPHLAAIGRLEPEHDAAGGRLARAGLADEAQRLALADRQRHAVDGVDGRAAAEHSGAHAVAARDRGHLDERRAHSAAIPSSARREASARMQATLRSSAIGARLGAGKAARLGRQRAARREGAAARHVRRVGHGARNGRQAPARSVERRQRADQALRIGMHGIGEQLVGGRLLDDAAGIHHRDAVAVLGDDAEIVADQHHRHAHLAADRREQLQDLRLDGGIERRWSARPRPADRDFRPAPSRS